MKRILIVEDARTVRMVIRRMLEAHGFAVDEAEHGGRALELIRTRGAPDGVLLDVNMPEMDGLECLRTLRRDPALAACRIIMCTTQAEMDQIAAAVAAGADEYIMKPFTEEILLDKLRQVGLLA